LQYQAFTEINDDLDPLAIPEETTQPRYLSAPRISPPRAP